MLYADIKLNVMGKPRWVRVIKESDVTPQMESKCRYSGTEGEYDIYSSKFENREQLWGVNKQKPLQKMIAKHKNDSYRMALFTALQANELTKKYFTHLYDTEEDTIIIEGLYEPWQTSTSKKVTRCAFNLYNGYVGEEDEEARFFSIYDVLDVDALTRKKLLEAAEILFGKE